MAELDPRWEPPVHNVTVTVETFNDLTSRAADLHALRVFLEREVRAGVSHSSLPVTIADRLQQLDLKYGTTGPPT